MILNPVGTTRGYVSHKEKAKKDGQIYVDPGLGTNSRKPYYYVNGKKISTNSTIFFTAKITNRCAKKVMAMYKRIPAERFLLSVIGF